MNELNAPHIDYAGLSPLIALTAGTCVTLLAGLFPRPRRPRAVGVDGAAHARDGVRPLGLAVRRAEVARRGSAALRRPVAVARLRLLRGGRGRPGAVAARARRTAPSALADYSALLLASVTGMVVLASAINLVTLFLGIELLSIPLYVMCALDLHRRTSLESGLKYLVIGSVGSATLLYGLAFIYGASGSTDFARDRARDRRGGHRRRPAAADRNRAARSPASRSRPRSRRSTSGRPTSTRARPRR